MAKKVVNLGTASLLGKDGDSNRVANTKLQSNDNELYDALGADSEGNLPTALPIVKGGTGTTTLAELKQNLGIDKVNNTADKDKPVSTATQTALNKKANTDEINLTVTELSQSISLALSGKEPSLNQGTDQEYYRGDKTWQILNKNAVGLDQVDNTADIDKPISTATQAALAKKVNTDAIIAIANGGTGATTAAAARTNLGINIESASNGTARYKSPDGNKWLYITNASTWGAFDNVTYKYLPVEIVHRGEYGGSSNVNFNNIVTAGTYTFDSTLLSVLSNAPPARSIDVSLTGVLEVMTASGDRIVQRWHNSNASAASMYYRFRWTSSGMTEWTSWIKVYHSSNTTTDSNGFIKAASPIVQLFADNIEMNDEAQQQNIEFEKLGVGDYLIKGSNGLSNDGWYIEQPKDANGNVYHAVVYEQLDNGNLSIKTFKQKLEGTRIVADVEKPVDIKENRFISIRLQEQPHEMPTAPQVDPEILDSEGNSAPSRLHELQDGEWIISEDNAAILENERLAAMRPLKRRQFRLMLAMNGYDLKEIEALIQNIEDPMQRTLVEIEWQDATDFERTNPTLLLMAEMMGLTTAQVDDLWNFGLTL